MARELIDALPYVKRANRTLGRAYVAAFLLTGLPSIVAIPWLLSAGAFSIPRFLLVGSPGVLAQAAIIAWAVRESRALRRALECAEFRVCPSCLYDYSGTPNAGGRGNAEMPCPECGHRFIPVRAVRARELQTGLRRSKRVGE